MSIVEKAVGKAGSPDRRPERPARLPSPVSRVRPVGERNASVVDLGHARAYDMRQLTDAKQLEREFRFLKRPLLARIFGMSRSGVEPGKLVMVSSCMPKAGKSFVTFNLAMSIAAEQMTNVLLIDADPIRRQLSVALGLEDAPGLTDLLTDPGRELEGLLLDTELESLRFLPAGRSSTDATELMAGPRMAELLRNLEGTDRVVLFDTPPLLITSEARALVEKVNHAVIVVAAGETGAGDVKDVIKMLEPMGVSLSFVLNKVRFGQHTRYREYYE